MSDLTKRDAPDRSKINLGKPGQAKHWAHKLGISREQLRKLIEKVGNSAAAVRKELLWEQAGKPEFRHQAEAQLKRSRASRSSGSPLS